MRWAEIIISAEISNINRYDSTEKKTERGAHFLQLTLDLRRKRTRVNDCRMDAEEAEERVSCVS